MDKVMRAGLQIMDSHKKVYKFTIDINGYTGEFTIKHPSLMQRMKIGVLRARYLEDMLGNVDTYTDNIAYMAASLETLLIKKPDWFELEKLDDYKVLEAVFDEYMNWANSFRRDVKAGTNANGGRAGADEETMANHEDVPDTD